MQGSRDALHYPIARHCLVNNCFYRKLDASGNCKPGGRVNFIRCVNLLASSCHSHNNCTVNQWVMCSKVCLGPLQGHAVSGWQAHLPSLQDCCGQVSGPEISSHGQSFSCLHLVIFKAAAATRVQVFCQHLPHQDSSMFRLDSHLSSPQCVVNQCARVCYQFICRSASLLHTAASFATSCVLNLRMCIENCLRR